MPSLFHTQGPDSPNTVLNPGGDPQRHSLPSLSPLPRGAAHTEVGQDLAAPSTQHPSTAPGAVTAGTALVALLRGMAQALLLAKSHWEFLICVKQGK